MDKKSPAISDNGVVVREEKKGWIRPVMMLDGTMQLICEILKTTYSEDGSVLGYEVKEVGEPLVISAADMLEKSWVKTAFYDNVTTINPPNEFHKTIVGL